MSYAPLSDACAKALSDKTYDKRKAAALEIEKFVFVIIELWYPPFKKFTFVFVYFISQNGSRI